ncbi:MAG: tripartite tricarboxylate transporter substrate binding protein [Pseudomonadota bacterium]
MNRTARGRIAALAACAAALFAAGTAAAADEQQPYPARPVRLIVPAAPGGGADVVARIYATRLGQVLGQPVFVENRAGAGGAIGATIASRAPADGYTLLVTFASHAGNPAVMKKPGYDLARDFVPVSLVATQPYLLSANPALGVRDVQGLIALARAQPDAVRYGTGSYGASDHLAMESLIGTTGIKMLNVPYKGAGPALTAVIGGEVQTMMGSLASTLPQVRGGRLVALGVTSAKRSSAAPDVPTLAESGVPGFQAANWSGLLAPAGTPRPIVMKLHAAIVKTLQDPAVRQHLVAEGAEAAPSRTPEEFGDMIRSELGKWSKVAKDAGIQPE